MKNNNKYNKELIKIKNFLIIFGCGEFLVILRIRPYDIRQRNTNTKG